MNNTVQKGNASDKVKGETLESAIVRAEGVLKRAYDTEACVRSVCVKISGADFTSPEAGQDIPAPAFLTNRLLQVCNELENILLQIENEVSVI